MYDKSNRIHDYRCDNFKIQYQYNADNHLVSKTFSIGNIKHTIENTFDQNNMLINTKVDNQEINYQYDDLGRLKQKDINGNNTTKYKYLSNGNRTSTSIKTIEIPTNKYHYQYDRMNNIAKVYNNDVLYNEYTYDIYGELLDDKKKECFELYYFDNLSLSEISENLNISRNAIFKQLKVVEDKLEFYEDKLRLYEKRDKIRKIISNISDDDLKSKLEDISW